MAGNLERRRGRHLTTGQRTDRIYRTGIAGTVGVAATLILGIFVSGFFFVAMVAIIAVSALIIARTARA